MYRTAAVTFTVEQVELMAKYISELCKRNVAYLVETFPDHWTVEVTGY